MAYKGKYKPTNPQKYVGDATKIVYRSLWERRCMKMFDSNKNIIKWASEEVAIPYRSPKDNRIHKYYPDFIVEQKNKRGEVEIVMIEVKPKKQTSPPVMPKSGRKTRSFVVESFQYAVNKAKWESAVKFCDYRGWRFVILTEDEIL
jgi:hypothetical protein